METTARSTDPTWTALIYAPYPEWVSGHLSLDGASVTVLRQFFADAPAGASRSRAHVRDPGWPRCALYLVLGDVAEIVEARIWAGLHYRGADVNGQVARHERGRLRARELLPAGGPLTIQGLLPGGRPTTARKTKAPDRLVRSGADACVESTRQPPGVFGRSSGRPVSPTLTLKIFQASGLSPGSRSPLVTSSDLPTKASPHGEWNRGSEIRSGAAPSTKRCLREPGSTSGPCVASTFG